MTPRLHPKWLRRALWLCALFAPACTGQIGAEPDNDNGGSRSGGNGGANNNSNNGGTSVQPRAACDIQPATELAPLARLSKRQYRNTLQVLVNATAIPNDVIDGIPEVVNTPVFSFDVKGQGTSSAEIEAFSTVANQTANSDALDWGVLAPCGNNEDSTQCGHRFIEAFGRKAFRRPLSQDQRNRWNAFFDQALADHNYEFAVRMSVEAFLQSPDLLYRVAHEIEDPNDTSRLVLDDFGRAEWLAYYLTDAPPDEELFSLAASGDLQSAEMVQSEAQRLFDTAGQANLIRFHDEWLDLDRLPNVVRESDGQRLTEAARGSLKTGMDAFVRTAYGPDFGFEGLLTRPMAFVDRETAYIYDVDEPAGNDFEQVTLDPNRRAGLLTQAGWLSVYANESFDAPVRRGVFVLDRLLCQAPPPPPGDVPDLEEPSGDDPPRTTRMRLEETHGDAACSGCHQIFDGVGFAFGNYDAVGKWRDSETDRGTELPIDASGSLTVTEDANGDFNNAVDLMATLAHSDQAAQCIATQWYRFGAGVFENDDAECLLVDAAQVARDSKNLSDIPVRIAVHTALRGRRK